MTGGRVVELVGDAAWQTGLMRGVVRVGVLVVGWLVLLASVASAAGSAQWLPARALGLTAAGFFPPRIAVDDRGDALVAWTSPAVPGQPAVLAYVWRTATAGWSAPRVLEVAAYPGLAQPEVGMTSAGEATLAWVGADHLVRVVTALPGASFDRAGAQVINQPDPRGPFTAMALADTPDGRAVVAYSAFDPNSPPPGPGCSSGPPTGASPPSCVVGPPYAGPLWVASRSRGGQAFTGPVSLAPVGGNHVTAALDAQGAALLTATQQFPDHITVGRRAGAAAPWETLSIPAAGNFNAPAPAATVTAGGADVIAATAVNPGGAGPATSSGFVTVAPAGGQFGPRTPLPPGDPYRNVAALVPAPGNTAVLVEQAGQPPQQRVELQSVGSNGSVAAPVAVTDFGSDWPALNFDPAGDGAFAWTAGGEVLVRLTAPAAPAQPPTVLASAAGMGSNVALNPSGSAIAAWNQGPLGASTVQAAVRSDLPGASFVGDPMQTLVGPDGLVPVSLTCRGAATCFVSVGLRVASRARSAAVQAVTIAGGQTRTVRLRLTAATRRHLRQHPRLHVRVAIAVTTTDGPPSHLLRTVTIRLSHPRHRRR